MTGNIMFLDAKVLKLLISYHHTRFLPLLKATLCLISKHYSVNKLSIGVLFQNTFMQWWSLFFRSIPRNVLTATLQRHRSGFLQRAVI